VDPKARPDGLPNFIIAGAMKSGTSSLRSGLTHHPEVFCAAEQHFFCEHYHLGLDWYREQFRPAGDFGAVGEKCPDYWYRPEAVERMAKDIPEARLIIMLRNPVDRAYSHYWHERRRGRENLSFAGALEEEPARIHRGEWGLAYLDMGRYSAQLERLSSVFPRTAIEVVLFEDFKADPGTTFGKVCRFLGVDDAVRPATLETRHNAYRDQRFPRLFQALKRRQVFRRLPRTASNLLHKAFVRPAEYPPLDAGMRAELEGSFSADSEAVGAWLGLNSSPWGRATSRAG
jgi:sulfotransferase family protein